MKVAKHRFRFLKIAGWIITGIISLILLTTLVFYLGRDFFLKRAITYLNDKQPGEVQMGQMNLIPFINFPNITLQLRSVRLFENKADTSSSGQEPILSLDEIEVTLDLIKLIRGDIMVSEARLEDGFVNMIIFSDDSISNLEHALGFRFSEEKDTGTTEPSTPLSIDLDQIGIVNVQATMENQIDGDYLSLNVNRFESSFSYLSGEVTAALEVDIDVNRVKHQTFNVQVDKNIFLKGSILFNPDTHFLKVDPSSLRVSGLEFETWGNIDFGARPRIDLAYNATNEGLELLNFLFRGILDLDEIEQIGGGSIHLNGTVQGDFGGDELPVVRVNGEAEELGFRIKSIGKDVTGISFHMFATNGSKSDLSEGLLDIQEFKAQFPEGSIRASMSASNFTIPELKVDVDCSIDLEGLDEMLNTKYLTSLSGSVAVEGQVNGSVDIESGEYRNEGSSLEAVLDNVSFVINLDSVTKDSLRSLSGGFILNDTIFCTEGLSLVFNGNHIDLGITAENLLPYLLGYEGDVKGGITISSEQLNPATLFGDTTLSNLIGEEIKGLYFRGEALIGKKELDYLLEQDSIPAMEVRMDSFAVSMPLFADISGVSATLYFSPDSLSLRNLTGTFGKSSIGFSGVLTNYGVLPHPDSGEMIQFDFDISSPLILAEDLLTINNEFLLPENLKTEYLKDFRLTGNLEAPAAGLVYDSVSMDFALNIENLGWNFRYYPDRFKNFLIRVKRKDDILVVENFLGSIGENNLNLSASIGNFTDSLVGNMYGRFELYSDLLDLNQLLSYRLPEEGNHAGDVDSTGEYEPVKLYELDFPEMDFTVNIGEIRYENYKIFNTNGKLRTSREKIIYLDQLVTSPEGRGTIGFDGLLNVASPEQYTMSAELNLKGVNISDLNLELQSGDTLMALKDHFRGVVDARGLAEIFITPELKVDMPTTTAAFNVIITNGALINFTPLQAAGKYLDTKDLNNVRFDKLRSSFTLSESRINLPIMNIESSAGQMLIQGEQGLDMSYLYLVHVPEKMAMQVARSAMAEGTREDGEDQVNLMKRGDFIMITVWSNGTDFDFKLGDRRNKFQE